MPAQAGVLLLLTILSGGLQFYALENTSVILGFMLATISVAWLISVITKNAGIIDVFWGLVFIVGAYCATLIAPHNMAVLPNTILLIMVSLWGGRLALHIFCRSHGKPEDQRYAQWREEGGRTFWIRSLFTIFLLQGWIAWAILAPVSKQLLENTNTQLTGLALFSIGVWLFGFCYQAIADYQLYKFKKDPNNQGKLLTSGLWQYSRHPNYFAEIVMWWAIYLFTISYGGIAYIIGPIIITQTIIKFSGSAMLEELLKKSKPGFDQYEQRVPEIVPSWLLPKKG